jgi:osmotically-inducible protein OsmY
MKIFKQGIALGSALFILSGTASASDQPIDRRVMAALQAAPYLYAEHITVTSKDGVITLHGMVGSPWDLREAIRISSRVDGVHAVVDDLEIWDFGGRSR